uniref:Uncharacterized 5.8 kDa protein n=1 Tax=Clover yellow mosaic virus TaxID=12177 RepID=Y5K_CYMV|nr:RecName: Full=Uncharacterized 5.8 kDa protein [Clover yellow mosaic virus]BAA00374.1 5.8K protein [Clover yellow mosaic virus]
MLHPHQWTLSLHQLPRLSRPRQSHLPAQTPQPRLSYPKTRRQI